MAFMTDRAPSEPPTEQSENLAPRLALVLERLIAEVRRYGSWEKFIATLAPAERLRIEGALHLLGDDLDRLGRGALA
jgi:hypothetical protein